MATVSSHSGTRTPTLQSGPVADSLLEREMRRRVISQTQRARPLAALGVVAVAAMFFGQMGDRLLAAWTVIALVDVVRDRVMLPIEVRRVASDEPDPRWLLRNAGGYLHFGLVWGSLPVFAAFDDSRDTLWLAAIVVLAVLSLFVVTTAASRALFGLGLLGMFGPLSIALLLEGTSATRLGLLAVAYGGIAVAVHESLHRHLLEAVTAQHANAGLAEQLHRFLSDRDPATGLLNRQSFIAGVEGLSAVAEGTGGEVVVAVGNVRRFAAINELHGESVGDELLALIGDRLQAVADESVLVARLDSDEFGVARVVTDLSTTDPALLLQQVGEAPLVSDEVVLSFDLHVARLAGGPQRSGGADLVADAVSTLRVLRARANQFPAAPATDTIRERRNLIDQLRAGMAAAGVRPWFQPIVSSTSRTLTGWEALVRWEHPDQGTISPDRLLPLIATGGLENELLDVVIDGSLRFLAELADAGMDDHLIHVNLTPGDLRQRGTADLLLGSLFDHRIPSDRLVVEVTEQDILHLDDSVRATLLQLDAAGVHLAVDDFGTGFSSLSHLLDLPTDHLKIDRRFIADMTADRDARMLVAGIIGLAGGMGLQTVAEGVETEDHASHLAALGCTMLQGYLIAPAMPPLKALRFAAGYGAAEREGRTTVPSP